MDDAGDGDDFFVYTGGDQEVPDDMKRVLIAENVDTIPAWTFGDSTQLIEVEGHNRLKKIEEYAFYNCPSLRMVRNMQGLIEIEKLAFDYCRALSELEFDKLEIIGQGAFSDCKSLKSINMPSIRRIGEYAFGDCTSLERITIPPTVIEIEEYAFNNCTNVREVVLYDEKIQIGNKAFNRCSSLERFSFPSLSNRLNYVIKAGHTDIEPKMDDIPAVEWRSGELSIPTMRREIEIRLWNDVVKVDKEKLNKVKRLIAYYEKKEATTLFELALWKATIDQADSDDNIDRVAHRIEVPGPVKDTVLQYLR